MTGGIRDICKKVPPAGDAAPGRGAASSPPPPVCAERQPALLYVSGGDRMRFDMVEPGHWRDFLKPRGVVSTYLQICMDLLILMVSISSRVSWFLAPYCVQ